MTDTPQPLEGTNAAIADYQLRLKRAMGALKKLRHKVAELEDADKEPLAVVGMACRFPGGADSPDAFWDLLHQGRNAIGDVPADRWDVDAYYDPTPGKPGKMYTRRGGFLGAIDGFDAAFFNISPREATWLDPQHRLLLEVTWESLEDAGQAVDALKGGTTGVFIGASTNDYMRMQVQQVPPEQASPYQLTGGELSFMAGRISFILGLEGPSVTLDTACSSSLTALHTAAQSLRRGDCGLALVGGVNLILSPLGMVLVCAGQFLAPDGQCKTFDASADGYARAEGCGMIVLKRLSDARRDGDRIHALIRGTAVNHDGAAGGLTVPSGSAQQAVYRAALSAAGVAARDVSYVEAHGTGTSLGDPIEIQSLNAVYGTDRTDRLQVGSVKTNIGHLEPAAGIAGLLKVVLALKHREIPAHLHLSRPNPGIDWDGCRIDVPVRPTPWRADGPLLAGVSSFGASGTNAHVILEEAPPVERHEPPEVSAHLLTLSAHDGDALRALAARYADHLEGAADADFGAFCFSANSGRAALRRRAALIVADRTEAVSVLRRLASGDTPGTVVEGEVRGRKRPRIAMLCTGQGAQYGGMGRELYEEMPVFRAALDRCAAVLDPLRDRPLIELLYHADPDDETLHQTAYTQPALFAVSYALIELWRSWGFAPHALMGHSVGGYAAACAAGVFDLETGLRLIAERARLMASLPEGGAMAALNCDRACAEALIARAPDLSIAAVNSPRDVVLSGARDALDPVVAEAEAAGIKVKRLTVSHAFHSALMDPILDAFQAFAADLPMAAPRLRLVADADGRFSETALDARYWTTHIRRPVAFADGMQALDGAGCDLYLEAGPGSTLLGLGQACLDETPRLFLPSLRKGRAHTALMSLARCWAAGCAVDWSGFYSGRAYDRVPVPTYPFQRKRFWFEVAEAAQAPTAARGRLATGPEVGLLGGKLPTAQCLYQTHVTAARLAEISDVAWFGRRVLSAAFFVEAALTAAEALGLPGGGIRSLRLAEDLPELEAGGLDLQTALTPDGTTHHLVVHARTAEDGAWQPVAEGRLAGLACTAAPVDVAGLTDGEAIDAAQVRFDQRRYGREAGAAARLVRTCYRLDAQTVTAALAPAPGGAYRLHPALLEQALLLYQMLREPHEPAVEAYALEDVRLEPNAGEPAWAWLHRDGEDTARLVLYTAGGAPVAEAAVAYRAVREQVLTAATEDGAAGMLYAPTWEQAAPASGGASPCGTFLLFTGPQTQALADTVAEALHSAGVVTRRVVPGADYAVQAHETVLDPENRAHYTRLMEDVTGEQVGAVHLWSLEGSGAEDAAARHRNRALSVESALCVMQALALDARDGRAYFATAGAQALSDDAAPVLDQSLLWGLSRAAGLEVPDVWGGIVDLEVGDSPADQAASVLHLVTDGDGEDHVAWRGRQRYVPRLDRLPAPEAAVDAFRADPSGIYLITGGLGGLGLCMAHFLVDRGARRLLLTGRGGLPAHGDPEHPGCTPRDRRRLRAVAALEAKGAVVDTAGVDVGDARAMQALFERLDGASLRGVVHAAGTSHPSAFDALKIEDLREEYRAKVEGAWLLHELTRTLPLDFFYCLASIAGVWGSQHVAAYAAVNHYLDGLARFRRAQGLPALTVDWGPWLVPSDIAGLEVFDFLEAGGLVPHTPDVGVRLTGMLLEGAPAQVVASGVDWATFKPLYEARARRPFLDRIQVARAAAAAGAGSGDTLAALDAARPSERQGVMETYLCRRFGEVLHMDATQIRPGDPLDDLGFDSMMVMEVIGHCGRDLDLQLYPREFFEHGTLTSLAAALCADLAVARRWGTGEADGKRPAPDAPAAPHAPRGKNPSAVFLLSGPRCGSTLMRVMLAGHSGLFCPPELHLLQFDHMQARHDALAAGHADEGLTRAVMELRGGDAAAAAAEVDAMRAADTSIAEVYRTLQDAAAPMLLVDKSPSYPFDMSVLERAEAMFDQPRYILLVRHPYAMIESFTRIRLDKVLGFHEKPPAVTAEEIWSHAAANLLQLRDMVGPERCKLVRYEDLVADPEGVMSDVAAHLGIAYEEALVQPYEGRRMTDGLHAQSMSIGDPNFHKHQAIDPALGETWKTIRLPHRLNGMTRRLAAQLGYSLPVEGATPAASPPLVGGALASGGEPAVRVAADCLAHHPEAESVRSALRAAGIHRPTWEAFGLGYAPADPHVFGRYLTAGGVTADAGRRLGLFAPDGADDAPRATLHGGLLVPMRTASGRLCGFYQPDTQTGVGADPETLLFGLDRALAVVRDEGQVLVVDDLFDVLAAHQAGLAGVVTPFGEGAELSEAQLALLRGNAPGAIVAFADQETPEAMHGPPVLQAPASETFHHPYETRTSDSPALGRTVHWTLLTPRERPAEGLPLVVFLQGALEADGRRINGVFDRLMAEGGLPPVAVASFHAGRSLFLNRHDGGGDWETFLMDEVLPGLTAELDCREVVLLGLSMGGEAALRLAFKYPDRIGTVIAHAPTLVPAFAPGDAPLGLLHFLRPPAFLERLFGPGAAGEARRKAENPAYLAKTCAETLRDRGLQVYFDIGTRDFAADGAHFLHHVLEDAGVAHRFRTYPGGKHNAAYFSVALMEGLQVLNDLLTRSRPALAGAAAPTKEN